MLRGDLDFPKRLAGFQSKRYGRLREPQATALARYAANVEVRDVAIELPTGYGKTLLALLIADLAQERGQTVAYLTGTNQLADQVLEQASDLRDLEVVRFAGRDYPPASLARYHNALAIGVMNYWTYFNTSPKVQPADLLIFDDAHLAEQPLAGLFAVRIDREDSPELYERLCELVLAHTNLYPSIELMREGSAGPGAPPELLAFSHWREIAGGAAELLAAGLPDSARFVWPRVRPHLPACGVLIGPSAIEIRPYHPPTQTLPGYHKAKQRLYLSATLGTMDDLQRRLGVGPITSVVDTPATVGVMGERIFILNPSDDAALASAPIAFALQQSEASGRTAWLCAAHNEADRVEALVRERGYSTYRLKSGADDDILDRWAQDPRGHLITAGRYDGLDFPDDVCRLVVLPSVPAASTEFERFVMAYLGDATYMRHRVGQRITQALGRANRREGDWAMYLGLAPNFATLLGQSAVQAAIPTDVRPTIDASLVRAGQGWPGAERSARDFRSTHRATNAALASSSTRIRPGRTHHAATAGSASDEVTAVTRLWLGDPIGAAEAAGRAASTLSSAGELEHSAFWWYVQAQAHFADPASGGVRRAIEALKAATEGGAATAWFVRIGRVLAELRGQQVARVAEYPWLIWDEWLQEAGAAGIRRALDRCRTAMAGSHDQQAEALETLGRIVGVAATRPQGPGATDAVWNWPSGRRIERRLWEVKTGEAGTLRREWVNQSLGQIAAERTNASGKIHVVGCIVTTQSTVEDAARIAAQDLCLVHADAISTLIDRMSDRLLEYADRSGEGTAIERGAARAQVEHRLPQGPWLEDLFAPSHGGLLRRDDVAGRFT